MNLEDARRILVEAMPKHKDGFAAEECLETGGPCGSCNRHSVLHEIERAECARDQADFFTCEDALIEINAPTACIEAPLPLIWMFFHIEEHILRQQSIQHLHHQLLIHIRARHRGSGAFRLHVECKIDVALFEIGHDSMRIVECEGAALFAVTQPLQNVTLPVGEFEAARDEEEEIPKRWSLF